MCKIYMNAKFSGHESVSLMFLDRFNIFSKNDGCHQIIHMIVYKLEICTHFLYKICAAAYA